MRFIKLFIKNNIIKLMRQWLSMSSLVLLPIILSGLFIFIIVTYLLPSEENVIEIGLVDLDKSKETELVTELITNESGANEIIKIKNMEEAEAKNKIAKNELSSYIIFPDEFIAKLYDGVS